LRHSVFVAKYGLFSHNAAMCGRYTQTSDAKLLSKRFAIKSPNVFGKIVPRYNIAPGQPAPLIFRQEEIILQSKTWGLRPPWARPGAEHKMINARSETASDKPAYREPFRHRRCLVPASGFYEWGKRTDGIKVPVHFTRKDGAPFAMAGLWEGDTFTILTTEANALVAKVHKRMPVILTEEAENLWLEEGTDVEGLLNLLTPFTSEEMKAENASIQVNSPKNEGPDLLTGEPDPQQELDL
jgi:putative SOS response-associated peptidase YedK